MSCPGYDLWEQHVTLIQCLRKLQMMLPLNTTSFHIFISSARDAARLLLWDIQATRQVKSCTNVTCQVEAKLTLIIPSITVTSCGREGACVRNWGSETLWSCSNIYVREFRKVVTITSCRKYGRFTVTQRNLLL